LVTYSITYLLDQCIAGDNRQTDRQTEDLVVQFASLATSICRRSWQLRWTTAVTIRSIKLAIWWRRRLLSKQDHQHSTRAFTTAQEHW